MSAANPMLDTASQRPATGLDEAARQLILNTLEGSSKRAVLQVFLQDRYAGVDDYREGIRAVWGDAPADRLHNAIVRAFNEHPVLVVSVGEEQRTEERAASAVLLHMPEPDFRLAVTETARRLQFPSGIVERITAICRRRGIPWEFTATDGFRWIGDTEVEASAMRPALSAIEDARLRGSRDHFNAARAELALGTPTSLRQSVHESACAVEGAMKVLLAQRGVQHDDNDAAFKLFDRLTDTGIVPQFMERCVLAAASPRNKRGGHGAGEEPHDVALEVAEAVLAAAAVAITYLCKRLP